MVSLVAVINHNRQAYTDQLVAIAKWIGSEFDYNPKKQMGKAGNENNVIESICPTCQGSGSSQRDEVGNNCTRCDGTGRIVL